MSALRDAATVLLLRDRPRGGYEVFMVKRHGASGFMGGAHVFPGGKLDANDSAPALLERTRGHDPVSARSALAEPGLASEVALALFVAALRETFEEAGVLLAELAASASVQVARRRMLEGAAFPDVLREVDATLRLDWAVPLARWITPAVEPKRFDTRFFVAHAPEAQDASHDQRETTEHAWLSPGEAISAMDRGEISLPPPTLRNLQWLADFDRAESVLAFAASQKPPLVAPVIQQVDGNLAVILPGDPLHPDPQRALDGPTRLILENGRWWSR